MWRYESKNMKCQNDYKQNNENVVVFWCDAFFKNLTNYNNQKSIIQKLIIINIFFNNRR